MDALTRLPMKFNQTEIVKEEAHLIPNFEEGFLEKLHDLQQTDKFCSQIVTFLKQGKLPSEDKDAQKTVLWARHMTIKQEILHHVFQLATPGRYKRTLFQIVIPSNLIPEMLMRMRDSPQAGHSGILKTFE